MEAGARDTSYSQIVVAYRSRIAIVITALRKKVRSVFGLRKNACVALRYV